jgi:hypothetical protein
LEKRVHLRAVPNPRSKPDDGDALATLLPPKAQVHVCFVHEELAWMFHRDVWRLRFRILDDGEHQGAPILWHLNRPVLGGRLSLGSHIVAAFVACTGRRPPAHLAKMRPSSWLSQCELLVQTRVVGRDIHGVARPNELNYSVISHVIRRTAGAPPMFQALQ